MDDKDQKTGFRDVVTVDLNNAEAVAHWTEHWNVSEEELREAVANAESNLVSAVAAKLGR